MLGRSEVCNCEVQEGRGWGGGVQDLVQEAFDNEFGKGCCSVIRGSRVMNKVSLDKILVTLQNIILFEI